MYFNNEIEPLQVSANDVHHHEATNALGEMLRMYYMHVLYCEG